MGAFHLLNEFNEISESFTVTVISQWSFKLSEIPSAQRRRGICSDSWKEIIRKTKVMKDKQCYV